MGLVVACNNSFAAAAKSETKAFDLGSEWVKNQDDGGIPDGMWNLKSNKDIYVTAMSRTFIPPKAQVEEKQAKDVVASLTEGRSKALNLVGITDWHIDDNKFTKGHDQFSIKIHGSFHDTNSVPVEFNEVHIWHKTKYQSLTINYPKDSKFGETKQPEQMMNRFISSVTEGEK